MINACQDKLEGLLTACLYGDKSFVVKGECNFYTSCIEVTHDPWGTRRVCGEACGEVCGNESELQKYSCRCPQSYLSGVSSR